MATLRLKDRQFGSEFCSFERKLIFDHQYRDVGYAHFIASDKVILFGSRFTERDKGRIYLLPQDLASRVEEGNFVEIEHGRVDKVVIPSGKGRKGLMNAHNKEVTPATSISEPRVPLPAPAIPMDEFVHRISSNWRSAEEDMLDKVMALLMVSAPTSVYGKGGIGSEGLEIMRVPGTGTPRDVAQTLIAQLPLEFRVSSRSPYRYSTVDSLKGLIEFENGRAPENSYSVLKPMRYTKRLKERKVPIQLPFTLKDAEMKKKRTDIDLDILEYQLTALYTPPPSENAVMEMAKDLVRTGREESIWDGRAISAIDPLSSVRIGLALTRLNVGKQFDGTGYSRRRSDLHDGRDLFRELLGRGLEEIERRIRKERIEQPVLDHPWRGKLKPIDREIYFELRARSESTGSDEFPVQSIDLNIPQRNLQESLERLNRYGYLLYLRGGTIIKLIIDDSPEEQS